MSTCDGIPFTLAELRKAKSAKFVRMLIEYFVLMSGSGREGNEGAFRNSHAIGKRKRAQRETSRGNWQNVGRAASAVRNLMLGKEHNELMLCPSIRRVSRTKLSIMCIFSIPVFVQPSSATTASTSLRRGSMCSGWERRRYNTCVTVYGKAMIKPRYSGKKYHGSPEQ
jgi:hypothetical protein